MYFPGTKRKLMGSLCIIHLLKHIPSCLCYKWGYILAAMLVHVIFMLDAKEIIMNIATHKITIMYTAI